MQSFAEQPLAVNGDVKQKSASFGVSNRCKSDAAAAFLGLTIERPTGENEPSRGAGPEDSGFARCPATLRPRWEPSCTACLHS